MARTWMCLLLAFVYVVRLSYGKERPPSMTHAPLLNYGETEAGDNKIESFDKSKELTLRLNISFFGSTYKSLYISEDGLISFVEGVEYVDGVTWSEGTRNQRYDRPFMAPFYHEGFNPVNLGHDQYQGKVFYRLIDKEELEKENAKDDKHFSDQKHTIEYFSHYVQEAVINAPKDFTAELMVVVTWVDVTDKPSASDGNCDKTEANKCKSATFQAVIIADKQNTFAMFNYLTMDIPYQSLYQSGFNGGYERGWFNVIPCHGACAVALNRSRVNDLPKLKGTDVKGRYFLNVGGEEIVRGGCLPKELRAGMLEIFPHQVGMFGGEKLEVSGKCLQATKKIYCKFGTSEDSPISEGVMNNEMKGFCPVPIMTDRGSVLVSWSENKEDWTSEQYITVVLPDRVKEPAQETKDKAAWYSRDASTIKIKWDSNVLSSKNGNARVEVKLIGYRELKDKVEFKELRNLGGTSNSKGSYSFSTTDYHCTTNCQDFEMGLLEVGLVTNYYGDAADRVAHRFGPIPLGWYVNKQLSEDKGSDWSNQMCRSWNAEDRVQKDWVSKLPKCPCTLDQSLADFGRWQAEPGCDLFKGSTCHYHKGAKHCVRSVQPTPDGAGNQCCYDTDGALMWSQLTYQGSTPDRGHAWGYHPYNIPGRVPSLSHWKHDVVPFYYCCLWNENKLCDLYVEQRPTTDCSMYEVPGLALVRGDPHITTYDSQTFNFGGKGDFWLLDNQDVSIQGRFARRRGGWNLGKLRKTDKSTWYPMVLTSLAVQGAGQIVEVHMAPENAIRRRGLDVRVGNRRHFFYDMSTKWQDFQGQSIVNNAQTMENNPHNNFTIMTGEVGVNVYEVNNLLHVTVAVPPSMKHTGSTLKGMGLLGMFDGKDDNDFVTKAGTVSSPGAEPKELYTNFGMSWAVTEEDCLFPFFKDPTDFNSYTPYYKYEEIPHDFDNAPSSAQIQSTCGDNKNCQWDYRMSGSRQVAEATKKEDELFDYTQKSALLVYVCGLPDVGDMAKLSLYDFSVDKEVEVEGCDGDRTFGGSAKFKCVKETIEKAKEANRDDYGRKVTDNGVDYMIHWVPKPYEVCSSGNKNQTGNADEGTSTANMPMIIGIAVGAVVVILIIVVIIIVLRRKKASKGREKPRTADRVRRDRDIEDTDEPMISKRGGSGDRERNPVYKPSRQASSSAV